jgi:hypothetical protein
LWLLSGLYKAEHLKLDNLARNYDYCIEEVVAGQKDAARTETKALLHHIHKCVEVRLQVEDTLETNGMRDWSSDPFIAGRACTATEPRRASVVEALYYACERKGPREASLSVVRWFETGSGFQGRRLWRAGGEETQLFIKDVQAEGRRYIVCRNEAEAEKDAADRQAIIAALDQQLKRGDKALIGNSAYRRYLRATSKKAFAIDIGKVAEEARYDGLFVLRTNAQITPLQAVLATATWCWSSSSSGPPRRWCAHGRSITHRTRRSAVTCSAPS